MKHFTSLAVTLQDGIAQVEFNRPERANAIDRTLWAELGTLMQTLDATPSVRVVVLSGRGRHFTAGIDLDFLLALRSDLAPLDAAQSAARCLETILWLQAQVTAIEMCRKPVIAAIHGACLGGGIDISSACDFRYATADARFAVKEIDLAIVADLGTLQRLPRIVGEGVARELILTGREFGAAEAERRGFLNAVFPDVAALTAGALATAQVLASKSPLALRGTKAALNFSRDNDLAPALHEVAERNIPLLFAPDIAEALSAQRAGRPPRYPD